MKFKTKIQCIKDEIKRREKIFPNLVRKGKMAEEKAELEIETMKQVLQVLTQLKGIVA